MVYASTFLSHSSTDKPLVEAVARELGQRGIVPWLDVNELQVGMGLGEALKEAVNHQATLAVFLSPEAVKSDWVENELKVAFEKEESLNTKWRVFPVFLGDPQILVQAHPILRERWVNKITGKVDALGIVPKPSPDPTMLAKEIAHKIAGSIYRALEIEKKDEVIIYLDQRGDGLRRGEPDMPAPFQKLNSPVLVFRPDPGLRSRAETLTSSAWEEFRDNIKSTLSDALGPLRRQPRRNIYLAGNAQLGLSYLIGNHFSRDTETVLHCIGRDDIIFTNEEQIRIGTLPGGNPDCETRHLRIPSFPDRGDFRTISLLLCKVTDGDERYIDDPLYHIATIADSPPPILVKHDYFLENTQQVMKYVSDVVALLRRLRSKLGVRHVNLYTSLPFNALPLLAANMLFVVDKVTLMEYRRDLSEMDVKDFYMPISF